MAIQYYVNGKIFTGQDEAHFVSAIGVSDGKIAWVGEQHELPTHTQSQWEDLQGKVVLPGLIDAHIHPTYVANVQRQVACMPPYVHSIEDMIAALKAAAHDKGKHEWIEGWGFDESKLLEGRTPTKEDLDRVSMTQPVQITRSCFHVRVLNSVALALCGLDKGQQEIPGGVICKGEDGLPNGILHEAANWYVDKFRPVLSDEEVMHRIAELTPRFASLGITAVTEVMGLTGDEERYRQAAEKGFKQRIAIYQKFSELEGTLSDERKNAVASERVQLSGIKHFMDGSISGATAYLKHNYPNRQDRGLPVSTVADLESLYAYARPRGLQIIIHAMGDAAIQMIIDFFKDKPGWMEQAPSVRIEHCTIVSEAMLQEMAAAGIGATMNINFMFAEYEAYRQHLDEARFKQATPLKSALTQLAYLAIASDSPATLWAVPEDPWMSIQAAVTRKASGGEDINADERIGLNQALLLYTNKAAQCCHLENTGQLKVGYHADFIVLDKDIFTLPAEALMTVKVEKTFIAGELIYSL